MPESKWQRDRLARFVLMTLRDLFILGRALRRGNLTSVDYAISLIANGIESSRWIFT